MSWRLSYWRRPSRDGELDLGPAVLEVERERDQRKSLLIHPCAQPVDLVAVDEKLPVAVGFVTEDAGRLAVRRDVQSDQPQLAVADPAVGVGELDVRVAK